MGCSASAATIHSVCREESSSSLPPLVIPSADPQNRDFHLEYVLGDKLGKGAFAQVHVATKIGETISKAIKAVKILNTGARDDEEKERKLQKVAYNEVCVWTRIGRHAHCVELHEVFYDGDLCYMVMERCQSSLLSHLTGLPTLNEPILAQVFSQMLSAIAHLHSVGVVHRDIKPDNFLCGSDGNIRLTDFGLSVIQKKEKPCGGVFGTAPFMCPEMLMSSQYDEKADMWSFAVVVYVLLFGRFPYMPKKENSSGMKLAIVEGAQPDFKQVGARAQQSISESSVEYVKFLLNRDPAERPSATDALGSQFLVAMKMLPTDDLPSLRPMVYSALSCGAFNEGNISRETSIDRSLRAAQKMSHMSSTLSSSNDGLKFNKPNGGLRGHAADSSWAEASTECGSSEATSSNATASCGSPSRKNRMHL